MKLFQATHSTKGFTVVEWLAVSLVLGALFSIFMVQFLKFRAEARQSNAKVELSWIYSAEKLFFTERGHYHSNLPYIGYVPEGIKLDDSDCPPFAHELKRLRFYAVGFEGGYSSAHHQEKASGLGKPLCQAPRASYYPASNPKLKIKYAEVAPHSYAAKAVGIVLDPKIDEWQMNDKKEFSQLKNGL